MMTASTVPMMAAMMLPGALPATVRAARASGRPLTAPLFAGSYLVVWAVVGLAIYALYRPPEGMSFPLMCAVGAVPLIQKELPL